jgi:hypothetical protein
MPKNTYSKAVGELSAEELLKVVICMPIVLIVLEYQVV